MKSGELLLKTSQLDAANEDFQVDQCGVQKK